jgi:hypothetical protein
MEIAVLDWSERDAEQDYELRCKDEIQPKPAELSLGHDWQSMFANARLVAAVGMALRPGQATRREGYPDEQ